MTSIGWCLSQKRGIQLVDSNENLAEAYIKKSEEALIAMSEVSNITWKISAAYYAIYFSLYAILQRIGIKSEIHTCTILFAQTYLSDFYNDKDLKFLQAAFNQRIESQYYTTSLLNQESKEKIIKEIPYFIAKSKSILSEISYKNITAIRKEIIELIKSK